MRRVRLVKVVHPLSTHWLNQICNPSTGASGLFMLFLYEAFTHSLSPPPTTITTSFSEKEGENNCQRSNVTDLPRGTEASSHWVRPVSKANGLQHNTVFRLHPQRFHFPRYEAPSLTFLRLRILICKLRILATHRIAIRISSQT